MVNPELQTKENFDKENLQEILGSIMTAEEYSRISHKTPYIFDVSNGDITLYYFGARHSHNLDSPMFDDIKAAFEKTEPDLVVVEGLSASVDLDKFNARLFATPIEKVVGDFGESGFAVRLAVERGIDWMCPEPGEKIVTDVLLEKGFSKDEIFAHYIMQVLPQYNRLPERSGFRNYALGFVTKLQKLTEWEDYDFTYENAIRIAEEILGRKLNVEKESNAAEFTDPIFRENRDYTSTVLNTISRESGIVRDEGIVTALVKAKEKYKKIFVVYGASHAVMQEPALRKALEK